MKAYKGFNTDMTCRGFQFEEGKSYEEEEAELCKSGFHACTNPLDCFIYYSPGNSVFHEVSLDDVSDETGDNSKVCAKKIKIGEKLDTLRISNAHFEYVKARCRVEKCGANGTQLTAQDWANLSALDGSSLASQDCSSLKTRDVSSLAAQNWSSLVAQNWSSLSAQNCSSIVARNWSSLAAQSRSSLAAQEGSSLAARNDSSLVALDGSSLAARNCSRLIARNCSSLAAQNNCELSSGENSIIAAFNSKAKAGLNSIICLANRNTNGAIIEFKAGIVDGITIKPDTWYELKNGEFVECT